MATGQLTARSAPGTSLRVRRPPSTGGETEVHLVDAHAAFDPDAGAGSHGLHTITGTCSGPLPAPAASVSVLSATTSTTSRLELGEHGGDESAPAGTGLPDASARTARAARPLLRSP